jgi:hypothetical protein
MFVFFHYKGRPPPFFFFETSPQFLNLTLCYPCPRRNKPVSIVKAPFDFTRSDWFWAQRNIRSESGNAVTTTNAYVES